MAASKPCVVALAGKDRETDLDEVHAGLKTDLLNRVELIIGLSAAEAAIKAGKIVDGIVAADHGHVDGALLDKFSGSIRVVSNYGVGVDHIDLKACGDRHVPVGNTPDVLSGATADMAFALMMAAARRISESDRFARGPNFQHYENNIFMGVDICGTTVGIVGMGRIGFEFGRRAVAFGMKILYHNRTRRPSEEDQLGGATFCADLPTLLREADHVVMLCPLTAETRGIIGENELKLMKPTATLVNCARGGVVQTESLTKALQEGWIFSAGLDVTEPKQLPRDHALLPCENLVLMLHRGSATWATRKAMADLCRDNLMAGLRGDDLPACCNLASLGRKRCKAA
jgi:glyoxylate reductase